MAAKDTAYAYDRKTGRWRKAGKFCPPPTRQQLRADSSGRALDASGKIVPLSALAKSRTPPKPPKPARKAPALTYDRASGRWRKGGKWASRPTRAQLRKDAKGRYVDGAGKLVPASALSARGAKRTVKESERLEAIRRGREPKATPPRPERVKRKRKRKRKPKVRRDYDDWAEYELDEELQAHLLAEPAKPTKKKPRVEYLATGAAVLDRPLVSSNYNTTSPEHIGEIAFNVINHAAEKAGKDGDNVVLYHVGIEFINTTKSGNLEDTMKLVNKMAREYPDLSFKFAENRVHVLAGSAEFPLLRDQAAAVLDRKKPAFTDIFDRLSDLWDDDVGWFFVGETDDLAEGYEG